MFVMPGSNTNMIRLAAQGPQPQDQAHKLTRVLHIPFEDA
jgi:hypothetical protein